MSRDKILFAVGEQEIDVEFVMRSKEETRRITIPFKIPQLLLDRNRVPASLSQIEAIQNFYHINHANLSDLCAHALLCVRDYAIAISDEITGPMIGKRNIISRYIAALTLSAQSLLTHAILCAKTAHETGDESFLLVEPRLTSVIKSHVIDAFGPLDAENLKQWRGVIDPFNP